MNVNKFKIIAKELEKIGYNVYLAMISTNENIEEIILCDHETYLNMDNILPLLPICKKFGLGIAFKSSPLYLRNPECRFTIKLYEMHKEDIEMLHEKYPEYI